MVELWIPITFAAALFRTLRTALQKKLTANLSTHATTFTRYVYSFPLAALYVLGLMEFGGLDLPALNTTFLVYCVVGGVAQIFATSALIALFALRNFAVGTTYSKTDMIQAALFGAVILGEGVGFFALAAMLVSLAGIAFLSYATSGGGVRRFLHAMSGRAVLLGLLSGAGFGISAVSIRAAALSFEGGHFLVRAGLTLAVMTAMQTAAMALYLYARERPQLVGVFTQWRQASFVGLLSVLGSIGWFTAMTLQNAAYVRTLGQVELVFAFLISHFYFAERTSPPEIAGILLIVAGILLLVNAV